MLMRLLDHEKITIGTDGTVSGLKEMKEEENVVSFLTQIPSASYDTS